MTSTAHHIATAAAANPPSPTVSGRRGAADTAIPPRTLAKRGSAAWFSGVAVVAMMLLYLLTSIAVIAFFRRERLDTRPWNTLVAPVLGALGIAVATWLVLADFTTLIGGDGVTAAWLVLAVPVVLVLGVVASRRTPTDHR